LVRGGITFAMIAGRLQPENVKPTADSAVSQFDIAAERPINKLPSLVRSTRSPPHCRIATNGAI
jgi:hypothetical protein